MQITIQVNSLGELLELRDLLNNIAKPIAATESIEVLGLTARSSNCLWVEGVKTIDQLVKLHVNDLLRIPNLGRRSADEIIRKLGARGLKLSEHTDCCVKPSEHTAACQAPRD